MRFEVGACVSECLQDVSDSGEREIGGLMSEPLLTRLRPRRSNNNVLSCSTCEADLDECTERVLTVKPAKQHVAAINCAPALGEYVPSRRAVERTAFERASGTKPMGRAAMGSPMVAGECVGSTIVVTTMERPRGNWPRQVEILRPSRGVEGSLPTRSIHQQRTPAVVDSPDLTSKIDTQLAFSLSCQHTTT